MTDFFQTAMNAFMTGDIKEAKRICKAILKQQPNAHPALHLLAMTEKRQGKYKLAIKTFNKALNLAPSAANYWNNLGETYREMGQYDRAIECYRKAIRYHPEYAEAHSNWGATLTTMGCHAEAEQKLLRAVDINPELINAIYNLSVLYIDSNSPDLARQAIERTLCIDPNSTDSLVNLGYLEQQANRFEQARFHYRRAIALSPSHLKAQLSLGNLYYENQRYREAANCFRKATEIDPVDFNAWLGLGSACLKALYFQDACIALNRALAINRESREAMLGLAHATLKSGDPSAAKRILERYRHAHGEDAMLHDRLAKVHLSCGELAKAETEARSSLALEPENVSAYGVIAKTKQFRTEDDDLLAMRNLYDHAELEENKRSYLAFTLARVFDMTGDHDAAFNYLEQANQYQMKTHDHGINERMTESIENLKSVFTQTLIEAHHTQGAEDGTPIFIIGLPRSGKTVTETFLCRHPSIDAAGEFGKFIDIVKTLLEEEQLDSFPHGVATLGGPRFGQVGKAYIGELRKLSKRAQLVTNTFPGNAFHVGMINLCLPRAKIIWIDRDSRDACFDMYKKNFDHGHKYTNDLNLLGEYVIRFNSLMDYWDQLLPGFIHKLNFEELITDSGTQVKALLDFCGLDWSDACLTDSDTLRKDGLPGFDSLPTRENAIGIWKLYEKHLSPLFYALEKKQF